MVLEAEPEPESEADQRRRQRRIRILLVGLVLGGIAWAFAITYSVVADQPEALDDDDRAAVAAACADTLEQLRALPDLDANSTALDAVALMRDENDVFTEMVARGRKIEAAGDEGEALAKWYDDWELVIERRAEYADELERTGEGRFGSPLEVVLRIETYAENQGLVDCTPESLQPDVVDAPRAYPEEDT